MDGNKRKVKRKEEGITLIALVITIIVLLILAGVSIAMLTGENGILTQAQRAKSETENAQREEENRLTNYEDYINNATQDTAVVGEIVTGGNKQYSNNGTAIIPEGFAIVPGLDNVEEGLVISDKENDIKDEGNQFVWVPVPDFTEFKREHFGTEEQKWWTGNFTTEYIKDDLYEPSGDGLANGTEAEKMYKSVKDNKGFYIGRYEAGRETVESTQVVSKKNKNVYNNICWNNDETMITETEGAVEKARNFSKETNYTNVTSTLVYGVQWDAIMRWLSRGTEEEQGWLTDSTGKGNYNSDDVIQTGSNEDYQMKHIYDLAGNVWEWTMEKCMHFSEVVIVLRGGAYKIEGNDSPCSRRSHNTTDVMFSNYYGFRIALYL